MAAQDVVGASAVMSVGQLCTRLGVSRSGFYAWRRRGPSERSQANAELTAQVREVHAASRGSYGSPRVWQALRQRGVYAARSRVARLMRGVGLQGVSARLYRKNRVAQRRFFTSIANHQRSVTPTRINQVWVGDVTYLKVGSRWRYLATVMDKFSRRIVGWSLADDRTATLTLSALNRAVKNRQPPAGLIFHSDRGIEYAAHAYRRRISRLNFVQSMNRPMQMNDNAHMESFFHSLKSEQIWGNTFHTDHALRESITSYIAFYNQQRSHSSLGYRSPLAFEQTQA
jgi:transposase InsO family protein